MSTIPGSARRSAPNPPPLLNCQPPIASQPLACGSTHSPPVRICPSHDSDVRDEVITGVTGGEDNRADDGLGDLEDDAEGCEEAMTDDAMTEEAIRQMRAWYVVKGTAEMTRRMIVKSRCEALGVNVWSGRL